jgi:dihydrofolate reductase
VPDPRSSNVLYTTMFVTLDGVMSDPEVWHPAYASDESLRLLQEQIDAADAMLIGRRTHDEFAEYWPRQDDSVPLARRTNDMRKFVVTSRRGPLGWTNASALEGDVRAAITDLKARFGEIALPGSATVVRELLGHGLIDEMRFYLDPLVRGEGRRLFDGTLPEIPLELLERRDLPNGVLYLRYRVSRSR